MKTTTTPVNRNKLNLIVDGGIFAAFLVVMAPHFSGLAIHEWLGIAFGAATLSHIVLHWQWIVGVTRRLFGKLTWSARLNYLLNLLLFVAMTVIMFSGLLISEVALPLFGLATVEGGIWRGLHGLAADVAVLLVGLHVALHWQWIMNATRRYLLRRPAVQPALPRTSTTSKGALR